MAGIYIHIPFCKQACHYCNFHFTTSLLNKKELVKAIVKEIGLRKAYIGNEKIETIYFGGGTPSLLTKDELESIITKIKSTFDVDPNAEITLEANPDDINEGTLKQWKDNGINRLSIGVQSFFEEDLQWMNRAHDARQAVGSLQLAVAQFPNITMDLIYGVPGLTNEKWKQNVEKAIALGIPHLSCYALTVEPKTPLDKMISLHKVENVNPDKQSEQFLLLMDWMANAGYEHYEISNFAMPGRRSRHNSSYWAGEKYLGVGPSSHSYNGESRQWNVSNNSVYIREIEKGEIPFEKEILSPSQRLNEYIMTSLRTAEGLDLEKAVSIPGNMITKEDLLQSSKKFIDSGLMIHSGHHLILTREGKLLADGIAADLFRI